MTKIKCPLCGMKLKEFPDAAYDISSVGCAKCQWRTFDSYPNEAWADAKKFVSKFPPIMRVQVGDKLIYFGTRDIVTVLWKDMEICRIKIKDATGERYIIEPEDVHEWPWELEQKGEGNND